MISVCQVLTPPHNSSMPSPITLTRQGLSQTLPQPQATGASAAREGGPASPPCCHRHPPVPAGGIPALSRLVLLICHATATGLHFAADLIEGQQGLTAGKVFFAQVPQLFARGVREVKICVTSPLVAVVGVPVVLVSSCIAHLLGVFPSL
jgi:hypothetical protein